MDSVKLKLRSGLDNALSTPLDSAFTASDGKFSFNVESGSYTITAYPKADYQSSYVNTYSGETNLLISLTPTLNDDEMVITVKWGARKSYAAYREGLGTPTDLDAFLYFPVTSNDECLVYYGRSVCGDAELETIDSISAPSKKSKYNSVTSEEVNGLEVIALSEMHKTTYTLYVQNYNLDQPFDTSGLSASFYNKDGLIKTVYPPSECSGDDCSLVYDTPLTASQSSLPDWASAENIKNAEFLRLACFDYSSGKSILRECQRYMSKTAFNYLSDVSSCPPSDDICASSDYGFWYCSSNIPGAMYSCPDGAESMVFCPDYSLCFEPNQRVKSDSDPRDDMCSSSKTFTSSSAHWP